MTGIGLTSTLLTAQRIFAANTRSLAGSLERLSTGKRINRGSDNPAGLITSENLLAVLATLGAEVRSLQRADHVATVADGALGTTGDLLAEANALVVANANSAGLSDAERQANQMQLDSILASVNRTARSTSFNGQSLLDGSATITAGGEQLALQSISTGNLGEVVIDGETYTLADLSGGGRLNIVDGNTEGAQLAISAAINEISTMRGRLGALQRNTIHAGIESRTIAIENTAAANSQIRDTDFAAELVNLRRAQLLHGASLVALKLTISAQSGILALLGRTKD